MLTRREGTIRLAPQTPTPPLIPLKNLGINSPPECERTPSAARPPADAPIPATFKYPHQ